MNVRIDFESGGGDGGQPPRRTPQNAPGQPSPKRPRKRKDIVMGASVVAGIAALVVALAITPEASNNDDPANKGKGGGISSDSPSEPSASPGPSDAPGLPRGTATASGKLGETRIGGAPRGFPHTEDGAVEAAGSAAAQTFQMFRMQDRAAFNKDLYVKEPPASVEENGDTWRAQHNIDDDGNLVDPSTGRAERDARFTSMCHPKLGAYKVETASPDAVTVTVWYPCITGVLDKNAQEPLNNQWFLGQFDLRWARGDWRIARSGSGSYGTVPSPTNSGEPVTSYKERAKILSSYGEGWELFADASASAPAEVREARQ